MTRGHIRKRGSSWSLVVDVGRDPLTNQRRQRWIGGFATRKEAQRALVQLLSDLDRGAYVPRSSETTGEFLCRWLESLPARGLRPATLSSYRALVAKRLIPLLGTVRLDELTAEQVNAAYAALLMSGRADGRGGLSPRSVRYAHAVLRKALSDGVRWGRLTRNVAASADPPAARAAKPPLMRTWSAGQLRRFLEEVRHERLGACFWLAATTGMRRGEVLGLRWSDLNFERARVSIAQTLVVTDGEIYFSSPKTERSRRIVALDEATVEILAGHRRQQAAERERFRRSYADLDLVFCRIDGRPFSPNTLTKRFQRHAEAAGLPRIRLHDLRHTHATLALQAGVHPKVVSERLGHSSVAITLDIYSHALPILHEEAAKIVAALVLEDGSPNRP